MAFATPQSYVDHAFALPNGRKRAMNAIRIASARKPPGVRPACPDTEARKEMIRTAAYLLAERRGFCPGRELDDWLAAERQAERTMANGWALRRFGRPA